MEKKIIRCVQMDKFLFLLVSTLFLLATWHYHVYVSYPVILNPFAILFLIIQVKMAGELSFLTILEAEVVAVVEAVDEVVLI